MFASDSELLSPMILYQDFVEYKNYFEFLDANIFELRLNGFTYKEICKLPDLTINVVESRLVKIRNVLRERKN